MGLVVVVRSQDRIAVVSAAVLVRLTVKGEKALRKICSIALLLCLAAPFAAQAQNPIANPGFDTGAAISVPSPGANPWYVNQADTNRNMVTWAVVSSGYHSATHCARATAGPNAVGGGDVNHVVALRQTGIVLSPSTTYKLGFWYRNSGPGWVGSYGLGKCDLQVFIVEYTSGGAASWPNTYLFTTSTPEWTYIEREFTTQATTATVMLKFQLALANPYVDKMWLDDVSFAHVPPPPPPPDGPRITDNFNRTAGFADPLGTTDAPNAYPWLRGVYNGVVEPRASIDGSKLQLGTGANCWTGVYLDGLMAADFDMKITMTSGWVWGGGWSGVQYRSSSPAFAEAETGGDPKAYLLRLTGGTSLDPKIRIELSSAQTGMIGQYVSNLNFNAPHVIRLRVIGSSHKVWIDNVLDTDPPVINTSSTSNTGAGYFGIHRRDNPTACDDLSIQLHDAYGTVAGTVRDASTSAPIEGAEVTILGKTAVTAPDGTYSLSGVITGSWPIDVIADGYAPFSNTVTVAADSTTMEDINLAQTTSMVVFDTFTREDSDDLGTTEDDRHCPWIKADPSSATGIAFHTMSIVEGGTSGVALGGGIYPADFDLTCEYSCGSYYYTGYAGFSYRASVKGVEDTSGYSVQIDPDMNTVTLRGHNAQLAVATLPYSDDFYLIPGPTVNIKVIGNRHRVWVNGIKYIDYSDTDLAARSTGGFINVIHNRMWAVMDNFYLTSWGTALAGNITGQVTAGGSPASGAEITVPGFGSAIADSNGIYTITDIAPGSQTAIASKPGYDIDMKTVAVPSGATVTQDFVLVPLAAGVISDTFTREDNTALGTTEDASHTGWIKSAGADDVISITDHRLTAVAGGPGYPSIALQGVVLKDFEASFDMTLFSMVPGHWGGLRYRSPDQSPYTNDNGAFVWHAEPGVVYLWSPATGHVAGVGVTIDWLTPHRVKLRVEGENHKCWIDGVLVYSVNTSSNTSPGYLAFSRCNTGIAWDNIQLKSLDTPTGTPADSVAAVKALGDNQQVLLKEGIITGKVDSLGFFYVEDANRASGIKVMGTTTQNVGSKVSVAGVTGSEDGEMFIVSASGGVSLLPGGSALTPVVVNGRVLDSEGLSAIGLLVKVAGKVTAVDAGNHIITIDDGSGVTYQAWYGTGFTVPSVNDIVICRGCAGRNSSGPVIWMLSPTDLRKVGP